MGIHLVKDSIKLIYLYSIDITIVCPTPQNSKQQIGCIWTIMNRNGYFSDQSGTILR